MPANSKSPRRRGSVSPRRGKKASPTTPTTKKEKENVSAAVEQPPQKTVETPAAKRPRKEEKALPFMYFKRLWILVFIGGTWGAMLDYLHTHGEAIIYPEGTNHWRGVSTFAMVYSIAALLYCSFHRIIGNVSSVPYQLSVPSFLVFSSLYAYTAYSAAHTYWITGLIVTIGLFFWYAFDRSFFGLLSNIVVGFCGAATESWLSYQGTMSYATQDIAMVPYWLPALYFCSASTYGQICKRLLYLKHPCDTTEGLHGSE